MRHPIVSALALSTGQHVLTTCGEGAKLAWSDKAHCVDATLRSVCAYEDHAANQHTAMAAYKRQRCVRQASYGLLCELFTCVSVRTTCCCY